MKILDVRTQDEFNVAHIKDAELFDIMNLFEGRYPPGPKDQPLTLYCESGNRSMLAKNFLESAGYTQITDGGSITDMQRAGYLLAK